MGSTLWYQLGNVTKNSELLLYERTACRYCGSAETEGYYIRSWYFQIFIAAARNPKIRQEREKILVPRESHTSVPHWK